MTGTGTEVRQSSCRALALPATSIASVGLAGAMVTPYLPLFLLREIGVDPFRLGLFMFTIQVFNIVATTAIGQLSDKFRTRRPLLISTAAAGFCGMVVYAVD